MMCTQEKKNQELNKKKSPTAPRLYCPGCHGGGTAEAGAGGPFGELGKAHLSHEFSVAAAHPAVGTWGVQHPHADVKGQGKTLRKDHSGPPSALCKMAPRPQIQPQRAKGGPGGHQGAAQHKYEIQKESRLSLCCDKGYGLKPSPQLMAPCQGHTVTSTPALSPRTAGHPCSSHVPKGARLAPKFLSSPCTARDHHSSTREMWPSSL